MNLTALTLLGLAAGLGQPPAPPALAADVLPFRSRSLSLDINYDPDPARKADIHSTSLYVSRGDQTWELVATALPTQAAFQYTAPDDGVYWFNMMVVHKNGRRDPPDVSLAPPARKMLIDATAPTVRVTSAAREGDEIAVAWEVADKFPNDAGTQVAYRPQGAGESAWQTVPAANLSKRTARFKPDVAGPVTVKVTVADLAGNPGETTRDLAVAATTTAYSPTPPAPIPPALGATPLAPDLSAGVIPTAGGGPAMPTNVIPPPDLTMTPPAPAAAAPAPLPITPSPVAAMPYQPAAPPATPYPPAAPPATPYPPAAQPAFAPAAAMTAPAGTTWGPPGIEQAGTPIAVGTGSAASPADGAGGQVINTTRFDLQYQVENGPSGVSRVDLYVTRDDGRSWGKWSEHSGRETPLKVVLDNGFNPQVEGGYGFRLVPVSGAGLADGAPTAGTAPDFRVQVDVTPPVIKVYHPAADPAQRNALVLRWEALDRTFGKDPIAIEWSEQPGGPWQPVTGGGISQVVAGQGAGVARVANTGSYAWQLPTGLGANRVYLKFMAWDAAGNRSEVVTPMPVLVDLTKPRAKIQGILGGRGGRDPGRPAFRRGAKIRIPSVVP